MVMRFCHAENMAQTDEKKKSNHKKTQPKCKETPSKHKQRFGSFEVLYSDDSQKDAAGALYAFMSQSGAKASTVELMRLTHALLDALWRTKNKEEGRVTNPVDQSICLSTLRPDNQWARANTFTRYCAQMQHGGYSVMTQIARLLHLGESRYSPIDPLGSTSEQEKPPEEDSAMAVTSIASPTADDFGPQEYMDSDPENDSNDETDDETDSDSGSESDSESEHWDDTQTSLVDGSLLPPDVVLSEGASLAEERLLERNQTTEQVDGPKTLLS